MPHIIDAIADWHTMSMMARPGMMKLPMKESFAGVSDDDKKNAHFIINKLCSFFFFSFPIHQTEATNHIRQTSADHAASYIHHICVFFITRIPVVSLGEMPTSAEEN